MRVPPVWMRVPSVCACAWLLKLGVLLLSVDGPPSVRADALSSGPLIIGYGNWGECDSTVVTRVREGVNVVIWFAINLGANTTADPATPMITGGPDLACVAATAQQIASEGLPTTHLISVGGWDAPHPSTLFSGPEWFSAFNVWNDAIATNHGGFRFDGFDWDLEGNDSPSSQWNWFTIDCLNLMGDMSAAAKEAGLVVSLVPCESYLDVSETRFSRNLTFGYAEWDAILPTPFLYHGRNAYAFLLAKFGIETFDFVTIQLYESYSHADYNISVAKQPASDYLQCWTKEISSGWEVAFSEDPDVGLEDTIVHVPPSKLVVGLAAGWCGSQKALCIWPDDVAAAWEGLGADAFRGVGFWNLQSDGGTPVNSTVAMNLTTSLNSVFHVRTAQ